MRTLIATALFGTALALTATAQQPPPGAPPPEPGTPPTVPGQKQPSTATLPNDLKTSAAAATLEGVFNIISGERDGKAIPEEEIRGSMVRIAQGKIIATDKDRKEFFAAQYTVDDTKKPWKLDMKSDAPVVGTASGTAPKEAVTSTGLVKRDGLSLTLIHALPGGEAPTEFKTKAKQQMFVLKSLVGEPPLPNKFTKDP